MWKGLTEACRSACPRNDCTINHSNLIYIYTTPRNHITIRKLGLPNFSIPLTWITSQTQKLPPTTIVSRRRSFLFDGALTDGGYIIVVFYNRMSLCCSGFFFSYYHSRHVGYLNHGDGTDSFSLLEKRRRPKQQSIVFSSWRSHLCFRWSTGGAPSVAGIPKWKEFSYAIFIVYISLWDRHFVLTVSQSETHVNKRIWAGLAEPQP